MSMPGWLVARRSYIHCRGDRQFSIWIPPCPRYCRAAGSPEQLAQLSIGASSVHRIPVFFPFLKRKYKIEPRITAACH